MANQLPARLARAAALQCGVVSGRQATEAGLSRNTVQARVQGGRWQRLHRGVYATFSGQPNRDAVLWAAVLYAGPGAMLSHQTAAEVAGLVDRPSELVQITVPAERRVAPTAGLVIRVSGRARPARHPARLPPQTRLEETVLDLADAAGTIDDAADWVTRALGRRLTTQDRLRASLAQRARIRWRRELTELLSPDLAGLMSVLERRYQRDVERRHTLPNGARQVQVRRGDRSAYRDVLYEEYATCVELDGRLAHAAEQRWHDIRRDNALAADGGVTLRYGWLDITARPCQTAAELDRALRSRGFPGARPCGPACPVRSAGSVPQPGSGRRAAPAEKSMRRGRARPEQRSKVRTRPGEQVTPQQPAVAAGVTAAARSRRQPLIELRPARPKVTLGP